MCWEASEKEILFQARIVTDHIKTSRPVLRRAEDHAGFIWRQRPGDRGGIVASVVRRCSIPSGRPSESSQGKAAWWLGLASRQASTFSLTIPPKPARIWWQAPWLPCGNISLPDCGGHGDRYHHLGPDQNGSLIGGCVCPGVKISWRPSPAGLLCCRVSAWISLESHWPEYHRLHAQRHHAGHCQYAGRHDCTDGGRAGSQNHRHTHRWHWKVILPLCSTQMIYDEDLLIKGLAALYQENRRLAE